MVHKTVQEIRVQQAVADYENGKRTIRESAEQAGLSYHAFLEVLANHNLIGGNEELHEAMVKDTMNALG